jgi:hypothetical protein
MFHVVHNAKGTFREHFWIWVPSSTPIESSLACCGSQMQANEKPETPADLTRRGTIYRPATPAAPLRLALGSTEMKSSPEFHLC